MTRGGFMSWVQDYNWFTPDPAGASRPPIVGVDRRGASRQTFIPRIRATSSP